MDRYDVVVIGGGAGGLSAARTAQRDGARTVLVNDGPIGGDCTFTGCVPSKTLIEAARTGQSFVEAMATVQRTVAAIAATENADVLRSEGIDVVEGRAVFRAPDAVVVDGRTLSGSHVVIATGARAAVPPIPGLDEVSYLTNENVFDLTERPTSLAIMGGGPIGCELAQAMAGLGVNVTIVEMEDRLLGREEPEAAAAVAAALQSAGVDLRLGSAVAGVERAPAGVCLRTADGGSIEVEQVLVAVGRAPNTAGLGLAEIGVEIDRRGHVVADDRLATSVSGVWAVGDVTGKLPFTHAADEMGRLAVWNARKRWRFHFRDSWIPWVTFTDPEVARVGVAEADAPDGARVAFLPMTENDRAITAGNTSGFIKLIAGPRLLLRNAAGGRLLGATIVGGRAGEMIHEPVLAMRTRMFTGRLAQAVHAYPTWSVGVQKAAAQFFYEIEGRRARPVRR